jgi:medium-chain acyl-[acyl-carrier-protein] hydrolase
MSVGHDVGGEQRRRAVRPVGRPDNAPFRLFCFPYAGGGASIFRTWGVHLRPHVDVWAVQLPAREDRIGERPVNRLTDLLAQLAPGILPYLDRPFAFFGHSMGGLIGWELARDLRDWYGLAPSHLIVSACRPPQHRIAARQRHVLPDTELIEELRRMNGTSFELLADTEVMRLLLPMVRADFAITETFRYRPGPPLRCPVSAFGGVDDPDVRPEQLRGWAELTTGPFDLVLFPGDHFYLNDPSSGVTRRIAEGLRAPGARSHPPAAP